MSGTYELDEQLFTKNPLRKRWTRDEIASRGTGESIFAAFWTLDLEFSTFDTEDTDFFFGRWYTGGLHTAVLPHPKTGHLTLFTGVNIKNVEYTFTDVDSDSWADGARMTLDHINLAATGSA